MLKFIRWTFRTFHQIWPWLRLPVAVGVILYLYLRHRSGFEELNQHPFQWNILLAGFFLCLLATLLSFYRWYLLVVSQELSFRIRDAVRLGFLGCLFNYVGPGMGGGDFVKALLVAREQPERKTVVVATVFLDRILGLLGLFFVATPVIFFFSTPISTHASFQPVKLSFLAGAMCGFTGFLFILQPGFLQWKWLESLTKLPLIGCPLKDLLDGVALYQKQRRILVQAVLFSIVGHILMLSAFYLSAMAVHNPTDIPGYLAHFQLIPPAELVGVLVPLPGGIGALEEAVAYFYHLSGSNSSAGFLTIIAYRVLTVLLAMIGVVYYFLSRREIEDVLEHAADTESPNDAKVISDSIPKASTSEEVLGRCREL